MATIAGLHHPNLALLLGYCYVKGRYRFLVYEFMKNGSLEKWVFGKEKKMSLDGYFGRYKVAIEVAKVLKYMHHECPNKFLHLDIKPENVLLDENLIARLSDFGLSRVVGKDTKKVKVKGGGTLAYMAPEYLLMENRVSEKADVYSYGMLLFELAQGRRNIPYDDDELEGKCSSSSGDDFHDEHVGLLFPQRAWDELKAYREEYPNWPGNNRKTHDVWAQSFTPELVANILYVALLCIQENPEDRPSMEDVVEMLEGSLLLSRGGELPERPRLLMLEIAWKGLAALENRIITGNTQQVPIDNLRTMQTIADLAALRHAVRSHSSTKDAVDRIGELVSRDTLLEEEEERNENLLNIQELAWLPKKFNFAEIQAATEEFKTSIRVGFLAEGSYFIGRLNNNEADVLVKRLSPSSSSEHSSSSLEEFEKKVSIVTGLQHSALPRLLGYCVEETNDEVLSLLVFAFPSNNNGPLERWIYRTDECGVAHEPNKQLGWVSRCQIAMDVGKAVKYLIQDSMLMLDERVVSPKNVWLDASFKPLLMNYDEFDMSTKPRSSRRASEGIAPRVPKVMNYFGALIFVLMAGRRWENGAWLDELEYRQFEMNAGRLSVGEFVRELVDERLTDEECKLWRHDVHIMLRMGSWAVRMKKHYHITEMFYQFKFQPSDPDALIARRKHSY